MALTATATAIAAAIAITAAAAAATTTTATTWVHDHLRTCILNLVITLRPLLYTK